MTAYAYFRGEVMPLSEAKVGIMNHTFNYGTGAFEGLRAYWNQREQQLNVFRMREHFKRLEDSCRILTLTLPRSIDGLGELSLDLIRRNEYKEDIYIRPIAYKDCDIIGARLHDLPDGFLIYTSPFEKHVPQGRGLRVCVSSWRRVDDNAIPARAKICGLYVNSSLVKSQAMLDGYDEAIMLTQDGGVCEGSVENIFLVFGDKLVTPPPSDSILVGITRNTVIELAKKELGLETIERRIGRTELYIADEVFVTGSAVEIAPVGEIDRRKIGDGEPGRLTTRLQEIYSKAVQGELDGYSHWLTPVYPRG